MTRKDIVTLIEWSRGGLLPTNGVSRGWMIQANAGSPIQPRARLARVMPSWVAER